MHSHGSGGAAGQSAWIGREPAENGCIAAPVGHPGSDREHAHDETARLVADFFNIHLQ